jgi:hypothetical protein
MTRGADTPFMVFEFLEGDTLREVMGGFSSGQRLAASRVVELVLPIARALVRAHELNIVHRDLKPENVFVTKAGQVKVLDFGIAKAFADNPRRLTQYGTRPGPVPAPPGQLQHTNDGEIVGTLPYMSPEQMRAAEIDHRSDLYSLGVIMFEMLTGYHPVQPLAADTLIANAYSDAPFASICTAVELPDALAVLVDRCLRKQRFERVANATEVVRALEALLPGRHGRQLAEGESPFPGLTAFQESDADRFFGRSRDVARMVARVRELPLTGVVGPSGVGKSSFIRAGVGPALKSSGERWNIVTLRPGRQPLAALASVVHRVANKSGANVQAELGEHHQVMHRLRVEPGYFGARLRADARTTGANILLFVDQFEELYTLMPDVDERHAFTAALAGAADDTAAPLRVVVSMRSDFLDRIAEDPRFMEDLSRGLGFLSAPDRAGLREALIAPVEMVGYRFETMDLAEDMLDALVGTPGALPLLQFAAAKLWDTRDRERRLLTAASYAAIGGISGALATHADDVIARMSAPAQKLAQKIFRSLITPERTRAIVELADLHALSPDAGRVLDELVEARLLVVQTRGDAGGGSVEIVHESLIARWPTLRRWLDEDQEDAALLAQLAAAAKQWHAKRRAAGVLWRGEAIEEARRWYAQRPRDLAPRDREFLEAGFALARRGERARRTALVGAFILLASLAAGAIVALLWIRGAEQDAKNALAAMQQKERERLAAEAETATAVQRKAAAEAAKQAAEADKQAAQADKAVAQAAEAQAQAQVVEKNAVIEGNREELARQNVKLKAALDAASTAKAAAEAAQAKAEKAAADAQKAAAALEQANAVLKKKNEELEKEKATISKTLKGL